MIKKLLSLCTVALLAFAATGSAKADTIYFLTEGASAAPNAGTFCSAFGGPTNCFGYVDLTQSGSNVDVDVKLFGPTVEFIATGSHSTFAFNDPSVTLASQIVGATFLPSGTGSAWSANVTQSGFGTFTFGMDCTSCGSGGSNYPNDPTELKFTVDGVNISSFAPNAGGYTFTADIFDNLVSPSTEPIGDGSHTTTTVTPEPSSLMLLGTGIIGAAGILRRRMLPGASRT
jgi:hypothetical protein